MIPSQPPPSWPDARPLPRGDETPAGRLLPHDDDAEQAVLGSLLINTDAMASVRDYVEPSDFYSERHQHIYRASCELHDRGEPIDTVTLRSTLDRSGHLSRAGGIDYIAELSLVVPSAASVRHYADIVVAHALRRRLITVGGEVTTLGFDAGLTADDAIDQAEQRIYGIADSQRSDEAAHIAPIVTSVWKVIEERLETKTLIHGVPTNFSGLDSVTQGLQPGELIILAARPSVGKTSFALNIGRNAAVLARRPVAIFSLEMTKQSLVQRLICSEAAVDSHLLNTGQADDGAIQRITRAMDTLVSAPMWIDDTPAMAISVLRARARRMKAQHGIELIIVDYLQLMRGGRQESRVQEVSDISSGLKSIAKELSVPVVALSQLSRESERRENRQPQLSDLRDSGSIEQDADVVLFIYRPGMHKDDVDRSVTELIVAKNRNGPTTKIDLHFVANQTTFREVESRPGYA